MTWQFNAYIIIIYFENVHFFHAQLDVCPENFPEHRPLRLQTKQFHVLIYTLSPSLPASQSTPHHLSHTLNTQRTKDCTKPQLHFLSFKDTSTSPSYALFSSSYADFQPSSPLYQSHKSTHSGHKLYASFPLCDMMHQNGR